MTEFSTPQEIIAAQRKSELKVRADLNPSETASLILVAKGWDNEQILQARQVTRATLKNQLHGINRKLGVHDRTLAVLKVLDMGQISLQQLDSENDFGFEKFKDFTEDERSVLDSLLDSVADGVSKETRDAALKKTKTLCDKKFGNITVTAVSYFAYKQKEREGNTGPQALSETT